MPGREARCSAVPGRARSASTNAQAGAYRNQPGVDGAALGLQLADHVGEVQGVVEDHQVGQQGGELRVRPWG